MSISVITSTNRKENIELIINNFKRQNYPKKELIILLNLDNVNIQEIKKYLNNHISVYNLGSKTTLGNCLNFGISKANYEYIAKMDDDDYYGENYLHSSLTSLLTNKVHIVGKSCIYIYFKNEELLGLRHIKRENKFVDRVEGSTLLFSKDIYPEVLFSDKNLGEDISFCHMAKEKNFQIYSGTRSHYVYLRGDYQNHTWKINNNFLINECIKCGNKDELKNLIETWKKKGD